MINQAYIDQLAKIESGNNPLAQNKNSSAKGRFQFVNSTAEQYGITAQFGTPEYQQQEDAAVVKFSQDNYNHLKTKLGKEPTYGELYLAHQQGAGGAVKLLSNPDAKAVDVLGKDEVLNNGGTEDMTAAEFAQKWSGKFAELDAKSAPVKTLDLYELTGTAQASGGTQELNLYKMLGQEPEQEVDDFLYSKDEQGRIEKKPVNVKRGAPSFIRSIVGSVNDPEDRLATIRKYYPDAVPYKGNNFIYTDPETGELTVYNPKGFDKGDVASVAREAFISVGSSMGATFAAGTAILAGQAGPQIMTPEEIFTVPTAATFGAGVGAGAAANAYDALMNKFGLVQDTRTFKEVAADTTIEVAGTMVGDKIGRAAAPAIKKALGGGTQKSRELAQLFRSLDIDESASVITSGRGVGRIEKSLEQSAAAAEIINKQSEKVLSQTSSATNKIVARFGKAKTKQGAGQTIKEAAEGAIARFEFKQDKLYQKAFDLVGDEAQVDLKSSKELLRQLKSELAAAPKSPTLRQSLTPAIKELEAIISTEKAATGFQFGTLRAIRTGVGREVGDHLTKSQRKSAMKLVYGALSKDMGRTAANVSPEAAASISRADTYTRAWMQNADDLMKKVIKFDADEKAYKFALSSSRDGGTSLSKLRKRFTPEEWDVVAGSVLNSLGEAPAGAAGAGDTFSVNSFLTNWNKLAPEAKEALFGGVRYKAQRESLDKLVVLMAEMKNVNRLTNSSQTAGSLYTLLALNTLGASGGAMLTGDTKGGAMGVTTTVMGSIVAPRVAARLLTNPAFISWLSEPIEQGVSSIPAHITRLVAIGEANPEIRQDVNEFIKSLDRNATEERK